MKHIFSFLNRIGFSAFSCYFFRYLFIAAYTIPSSIVAPCLSFWKAIIASLYNSLLISFSRQKLLIYCYLIQNRSFFYCFYNFLIVAKSISYISSLFTVILCILKYFYFFLCVIDLIQFSLVFF